MISFLPDLLRLSVLGSLLAGVLFLLKPLLRGRVSRAVSYYLWLLVLLRLCIPVGLTLTLPEPSRTDPVTAPAVQEQDTVPASTQPTATPAQATTPTAAENTNPQPKASTQKTPGVEPGQVLAFLWAVGAVVVGGWYVMGYLRVRHTIHRTAGPASPAARELLAELDPSGQVRLVVSPAVGTPLLLGVLRPTVVLPQGVTDPKRLRDILAHELTHARRYDLLYKWFAAFAASVHWFNPLLPFIRREVGRACELSCDEAVVKALDASRRKHYGETLLALAADAPAGTLPLAVTLCEEKKHLQERLVNIVNVHKRTPAAILLTLVVAATLGGCSLFTHAAAAPEKPEAPPYPEALTNGDATISYGMDRAEVEGQLGPATLISDPDDIFYALSYSYGEGEDTISVSYENGKVCGVSLGVDQDPFTDRFHQAEVPFRWTTEKGITFGSSEEDVLAAYPFAGRLPEQGYFIYGADGFAEFRCYVEGHYTQTILLKRGIGVVQFGWNDYFQTATLHNSTTGTFLQLGMAQAEIEALLGPGTLCPDRRTICPVEAAGVMHQQLYNPDAGEVYLSAVDLPSAPTGIDRPQDVASYTDTSEDAPPSNVGEPHGEIGQVNYDDYTEVDLTDPPILYAYGEGADALYVGYQDGQVVTLQTCPGLDCFSNKAPTVEPSHWEYGRLRYGSSEMEMSQAMTLDADTSTPARNAYQVLQCEDFSLCTTFVLYDERLTSITLELSPNH